jgi:addiction module RelE/StbE family toxin
MDVFWTNGAERDRDAIFDYLLKENPDAAVRLDQAFTDVVATLADHPLLGRTGQISGTRELFPHENYRLVYEVTEQRVWVLALVHTSRQWPNPER